jgi:phosphoribosylamine-glycine ligase
LHVNAAGVTDAAQRFGASVFCAGVSKGQDDELVTSGGRVLTVVATASSLSLAADKATHAASLISFTGRTYRTDIAHKALR